MIRVLAFGLTLLCASTALPAVAQSIWLQTNADIPAASREALAIELRARGYALESIAFDSDAREMACTGEIVLRIAASDPPTARPIVEHLGCTSEVDRHARLPLPLDTISPRSFALIVADLATTTPVEVTSEQPVESAESADVTTDPPTSNDNSDVSDVPTAPLREVVIRHRPDRAGMPFVQVQLDGQIGFLPREESMSEPIRGFGAQLSLGVGFEFDRWLRAAIVGRAGWTWVERALVQLSAVPAFSFPGPNSTSGPNSTIIVAPEIGAAWSEDWGMAFGGTVGTELSLSDAGLPLRGFFGVRTIGVVFEHSPTLFSLGIVLGMEILP